MDVETKPVGCVVRGVSERCTQPRYDVTVKRDGVTLHRSHFGKQTESVDVHLSRGQIGLLTFYNRDATQPLADMIARLRDGGLGVVVSAVVDKIDALERLTNQRPVTKRDLAPLVELARSLREEYDRASEVLAGTE